MIKKECTFLFLFFIGGLIAVSCQNRASQTDTDTLFLRNNHLQLILDLRGGAITSLNVTGSTLNPFNWSLPVEKQPEINKNGYPFQGHFISLGTWGMPTEGEQKEGLRLYGEANLKKWEIQDSITALSAKVGFKGTIEKLDVERTLHLYKNAPVVRVTESVTNRHPIGRMYNFLQHATFGGQFSTKDLQIDTNAGRGFYQKAAYPRTSYDSLETNSFIWPKGVLPDGPIDLRSSGSREMTYLTSHVFDENISMGWATALNPKEGLLIGYVWNIKEYPWLNVWHQYIDGVYYGRAIEFATCGLGLHFETLAKEDLRFFGKHSFEFIDAGEQITKSYTLFALPVSKRVSEVQNVNISAGVITIYYLEKGKLQKTEIELD
ncbi:hypothetical protein B0O79_3339 [Flavobacteriaceae bacterium MAR_2009_75]|nr:hypothetical protein B0O79_3339 [Flavobacteriaceae bacterium MAR_2009_75]